MATSSLMPGESSTRAAMEFCHPPGGGARRRGCDCFPLRGEARRFGRGEAGGPDESSRKEALGRVVGMVTCARWITARMAARAFPRAPRPYGLVFCFRPATGRSGAFPGLAPGTSSLATPRRAVGRSLGLSSLTPQRGAQAVWLCQIAYCVSPQTSSQSSILNQPIFQSKTLIPPTFPNPQTLNPSSYEKPSRNSRKAVCLGPLRPRFGSWTGGALRPPYTRTGAEPEPHSTQAVEPIPAAEPPGSGGCSAVGSGNPRGVPPGMAPLGAVRLSVPFLPPKAAVGFRAVRAVFGPGFRPLPGAFRRPRKGPFRLLLII